MRPPHPLLPLFALLARLLVAPLTSAVAAQRPAPATGTIVGVAHDSLTDTPLAGATIQLVGPGDAHRLERSVRTDPGGRFRIDGVPAGRYLVGVLHPAVEGRGLEPPVRALALEPGDTLRVRLAAPSAAARRLAACGGDLAAVVGVVRDAAGGTPRAGAIVESAWLEYDVTRGAVSRRRAGAADTTGAAGVFVLCDVPRGGSLALRATDGPDTTAILDLPVPAAGLLRRDLFLAGARAGAGAGTLHGRVTDASRRPIADVVVGIEGGPVTRTGTDGAWHLAGLPMGTRALEARRVGFYPARIPVDIVPGAPPVEVALAEFRAVLDTVRVTASRWRLQGTGFEQRRRAGAGRYITAADLLQTPILFTADAFRMVPGVRLERTTFGESRLTLRGPFGRCAPDVYIDGLWMRALTADDINAFVSPDEVAGIEIYSGAFVPMEFQRAMGGCGSIVIWTKVGENPARRWSSRRRALHGVAVALLATGLGILFAHH